MDHRQLQGRPSSVGDFTSQSQFEILKQLHQSNGGEVQLARVREQRSGLKEVILKRRKFAELGKAKDMLNEYQILKKLNHPNVIGCYGYFWEADAACLFVVLEYANRGDLHTELQNRRQMGDEHFSNDEVWDIFIQVLLGLAHIHSKGIVHRDIKSLNLLLTATGSVKVGDFGVSRVMSERTLYLESFYGTPLYLSPEIVQGQPYSQTTDVWSLGVVLYELLTLRPPFGGSCLQDVISAVVRATFAPLPSFRPPELVALVTEMLTREAEYRPHTADLIQRLHRQGRIRLDQCTVACGQRPSVKACLLDAQENMAPRNARRHSVGTPPVQACYPEEVQQRLENTSSTEFRPPQRTRPPTAPTAALQPAGRSAAPPRGRSTLWDDDGHSPGVQVVRVHRRAASATPQTRKEDPCSPQVPPELSPQRALQVEATPANRAIDHANLKDGRVAVSPSDANYRLVSEVDDQREGKPKSLREERWEERRQAHMQRLACGGSEVIRVGARAAKARDEQRPAEEHHPVFAGPIPCDRAEAQRPGKASHRASSEGALARAPERSQSQPRRAPPVRYDIIGNRWINA